MPAGPDDLCTVAELKAWLPNQGNNDDVALQSLITNASYVILNEYLNRPHIISSLIGAVTETVDGNGSDRVLPRNYPIISVTGVSVDGVAIQQSQGFTNTSQVTGFLWDARRIMLRGFRFCRGLQNVVLNYTAGFPAVPVDLKQAALEAFALAYRQRTHVGEKSNSIGGQVTTSFDMSECPPRSMSVFSQYRRLAL
jgi:hypothetical protein